MSNADMPLDLWELPEGDLVGTGLNPASVEETRLLQSVGNYPEDWLLDDREIEQRLKGDKYKESRAKLAPWMINQSRLGKCNASAAQAAVEQVRESQGFNHEVLCDNQMYWRINGGQDRGSALVSAFNELQKNGISSRVLKIDGRDYVIPVDVYNERSLPRGIANAATADARRFLGWEFYKVPTNYSGFRRVVASALARWQPVVFAWHVGSESMRLKNGYVQQGRGKGNHATVWHSAKWVGGTDLVHPDVKNSWGPSQDSLYGPTGTGWGDGGYGLFTMQSAYQCIKWHDFYVAVSVRPDPQAIQFGV